MFRPRTFHLDPDHPLSNGLQLFLGGRSPGGSTAFDSGPFGNHFTLVNAPTSVTHDDRYGIRFSSASNSYGTRDFQRSADKLTASVWVTYHNTTPSWFVLSAQTAPYTSGYDWGLYNESGQTRVYLYNSSSSLAFTAVGYTITIGQRFHFLLRYTGAKLEQWVNGVKINDVNQTGSVRWQYPVALGGARVAFCQNATLSDAIIWTRSVADSEIALLASDDPTYDGWIVPTVRRSYRIFDSGDTPPATNAPTGHFYGPLVGPFGGAI